MKFSLAPALASALLLLPLMPVRADYQDGVDAYQRGDFLGALDEWRPLAEAGDPVAQNSIGALYDRGLGVTENNVEAARWYLSAAELGLPLAMRNLGALYAAGDGLPQDLNIARLWFERAAAQGDQPSIDWLQRMQLAVPAANPAPIADQPQKPADGGIAAEGATPAPAIATPTPSSPPEPAPAETPLTVSPAPAPAPAVASAPAPTAGPNWLTGFWEGPALGCPPNGGLEFTGDRLRSWYGGRVSAELAATYAFDGDKATVTIAGADGANHDYTYRQEGADRMIITSVPPGMPESMIGAAYRRCANP